MGFRTVCFRRSLSVLIRLHSLALLFLDNLVWYLQFRFDSAVNFTRGLISWCLMAQGVLWCFPLDCLKVWMRGIVHIWFVFLKHKVPIIYISYRVLPKVWPVCGSNQVINACSFLHYSLIYLLYFFIPPVHGTVSSRVLRRAYPH